MCCVMRVISATNHHELMRDFLRRIFWPRPAVPGFESVIWGGPELAAWCLFALQACGSQSEQRAHSVAPSSSRAHWLVLGWIRPRGASGQEMGQETRGGVKSDIGIGRQVRLRRDLTSRIHRRTLSAPLFWPGARQDHSALEVRGGLYSLQGRGVSFAVGLLCSKQLSPGDNLPSVFAGRGGCV